MKPPLLRGSQNVVSCLSRLPAALRLEDREALSLVAEALLKFSQKE